MAYVYIDSVQVNNWGWNILIKDDAEKANEQNNNNTYQEFTITAEQYEDLKLDRKNVRFNNSNELEWMDQETMTWNSVEEINQYVSDNFGHDPRDYDHSPIGESKKETWDKINAIDWSSETFPLTGHFKVLCSEKGVTWQPKHW